MPANEPGQEGRQKHVENHIPSHPQGARFGLGHASGFLLFGFTHRHQINRGIKTGDDIADGDHLSRKHPLIERGQCLALADGEVLEGIALGFIRSRQFHREGDINALKRNAKRCIFG